MIGSQAVAVPDETGFKVAFGSVEADFRELAFLDIPVVTPYGSVDSHC